MLCPDLHDKGAGIARGDVTLNTSHQKKQGISCIDRTDETLDVWSKICLPPNLDSAIILHFQHQQFTPIGVSARDTKISSAYIDMQSLALTAIGGPFPLFYEYFHRYLF